MKENGKPTLLVVDDEPNVRELVSLLLRNAGYTVYQADGGEEAIAMVADPDFKVDILLTDIIMPGMNGRELADRICALNPRIKVLFVSGYSANVLASRALCPEGADYIRKPFGAEMLLDRVSRVWSSSPKWYELLQQA
ncbi:MAG: multi-sensor hybrid histidine kinase [Fibrobacteres bacterium]|nr:multi-sensor hybrid histidine kinase [Fibrobacterota bacterium]